MWTSDLSTHLWYAAQLWSSLLFGHVWYPGLARSFLEILIYQITRHEVTIWKYKHKGLLFDCWKDRTSPRGHPPRSCVSSSLLAVSHPGSPDLSQHEKPSYSREVSDTSRGIAKEVIKTAVVQGYKHAHKAANVAVWEKKWILTVLFVPLS